MATPRYFQFYDVPEVDQRYGRDGEYTERCDRISTQLYQLLKAEVRVLRQVPGDCLTTTAWDLCYCAGRLVDGIPREHCTLERSCEEESTQLLKLSQRFVEHDLVGERVRSSLNMLFAYVRGELSNDLLEAVS